MNLEDQAAKGTRIFRDANGKKLLSKKFTVAPWSTNTIDFPESAHGQDVSVFTKMRRKSRFSTRTIERIFKDLKDELDEINVINGNNLQ